MLNIYVSKIEHCAVVVQEDFLPVWVELGRIVYGIPFK